MGVKCTVYFFSVIPFKKGAISVSNTSCPNKGIITYINIFYTV